MIYLLAVGAYLFGLVIVICMCRMAKLSAEHQFPSQTAPLRKKARQRQVLLGVPVRPIPFETPRHTQRLRSV